MTRPVPVQASWLEERQPLRFRLMATIPVEDELHQAVANALRVLLPPCAFWTSHELRNAASAAEGANRKRRGCRAGFPDLSVWWRERVFLFELKRSRGGALSEAQKTVHGELASAGFPVTVARSVDDVLDVLAAGGVKLRGRVAA